MIDSICSNLLEISQVPILIVSLEMQKQNLPYESIDVIGDSNLLEDRKPKNGIMN